MFLLPPQLRRYYEGVLEAGASLQTWSDAISLYQGLSAEDRSLVNYFWPELRIFVQHALAEGTAPPANPALAESWFAPKRPILLALQAQQLLDFSRWYTGKLHEFSLFIGLEDPLRMLWASFQNPELLHLEDPQSQALDRFLSLFQALREWDRYSPVTRSQYVSQVIANEVATQLMTYVLLERAYQLIPVDALREVLLATQMPSNSQGLSAYVHMLLVANE